MVDTIFSDGRTDILSDGWMDRKFSDGRTDGKFSDGRTERQMFNVKNCFGIKNIFSSKFINLETYI